LFHIPSEAKYLGIPLFPHQSKKATFNDFVDKVPSKGRKDRLLSQAARNTLIKSVANVIPTYIMSLLLVFGKKLQKWPKFTFEKKLKNEVFIFLFALKVLFLNTISNLLLMPSPTVSNLRSSWLWKGC
jgi:hypothetical protein